MEIIVAGLTVRYDELGNPVATSNPLVAPPVVTPRTSEVKLSEAKAVLAEADSLPTPITPADLADILARAALALDGGA